MLSVSVCPHKCDAMVMYAHVYKSIQQIKEVIQMCRPSIMFSKWRIITKATKWAGVGILECFTNLSF